MNRAIYTLSTVLAVASVLTAAMGSTLAQSAPSPPRLTPLQRQQLSRDLVPSGADNFFKAGQVALEREIQRLSRAQSPLNEKLLNVKQGGYRPPNERVGQPATEQPATGQPARSE